MKYLFNKTPDKNYFFSDNYVDPSRSPFIKQCISIIYTGDTLDDIVTQILNNNLSYEKFKVRYVNLEDENIEFNERRRIEYVIGFNINGEADVHNPRVRLGAANVNGKWILGELDENKNKWKLHDQKPYFYCNALGVRTARALVNIAVGNDLDARIIDPCCGIGTVVMEALSMGLNIRGNEINPLIAENAKRNLEFFGYEDVITNGDMHEINDKYDVAIVDMPYGLFNPTTLKIQTDIINSARRIADKAVFVTYEDMDEYFVSAGFSVVDKCSVAKGSFVRHITICK
jgi:tRNA G10  N-methylase Trm11